MHLFFKGRGGGCVLDWMDACEKVACLWCNTFFFIPRLRGFASPFFKPSIWFQSFYS